MHDNDHENLNDADNVQTDLELDIVGCQFSTVPYPISLPNPKEPGLKYKLALTNIEYVEMEVGGRSRKDRRAR